MVSLVLFKTTALPDPLFVFAGEMVKDAAMGMQVFRKFTLKVSGSC